MLKMGSNTIFRHQLRGNVRRFLAIYGVECQRSFVTAAQAVIDDKTEHLKMQAWQIHAYGGNEELVLCKSARKPQVKQPTDVLIQVLSSSVNPIDVAMMGGYGNVMLNAIRQVQNCSLSPQVEFPLTLGRDFCGRVVGKGLGVRSLRHGDEVWGTIPPFQQGSHAEHIVVRESLVHRKPTALNNIEAGSMLYAGVSAWSALKVSGDLYLCPAKGKRALVLGGSGGVGLLAVQMLKAWGAQVVATCRTDAVPLLESFCLDGIIDYTQPDADKQIRCEGKYDIILDCAGLGADVAPNYSDCLKDWKGSKFVTLRSPMLHNVDTYGLLEGMVRNAVDLVVPNVKTLQAGGGSTVRWGFYAPIPQAIREISTLVKEGKICPTVEKVYPFEELPAAYNRIREGHLRGKIVISMEDYGTENEYKKNDEC